MKPFNVFPYDSNIDFMRMRWVSLSVAFLLMVVAVVLLYTFPGLVTWLPGHMIG